MSFHCRVNSEISGTSRDVAMVACPLPANTTTNRPTLQRQDVARFSQWSGLHDTDTHNWHKSPTLIGAPLERDSPVEEFLKVFMSEKNGLSWFD